MLLNPYKKFHNEIARESNEITEGSILNLDSGNYENDTDE